MVNNVTQKSARKLWHYAILSYDKLPKDPSRSNVEWQGNLGILNTHRQGKRARYDLVEKVNDRYRFYFGVTEDGIHGPWLKLLGQDED